MLLKPTKKSLKKRRGIKNNIEIRLKIYAKDAFNVVSGV